VNLEQRLAADLRADLPAWVDRVLARVASEVPDLVRDDTAVDLATSSTGALLTGFADVLVAGAVPDGIHAPVAALGFARHLARTTTSIVGLLRSYRLGQEVLFERAAALAASSDTDGLHRVGVLTFRFVDAVVGDVAAEFERERDASLRSSQLRRERMVARLLDGEPVARAEAERVLGWRLRGPQLALTVWAEGEAPEVGTVTRIARLAAGWLGTGALVVPGPSGEVHAWTAPGAPVDPPPDLVEELDRIGLRLAVGEAGDGVDGFAVSRRQADAVRRVSRHLRGRTVLRYADVALLHLLLADPVAAASFVRTQLGALAAAEEVDLRATALAFLTSGRDATATAASLALHRNTVMRRLARAEVRLGRPVGARPVETEAALVLAAEGIGLSG